MTHLGDLLSAYLDGELAPDEERGILGHLEECDRCRLELAEIDSARTALRGLPVLDVPFALAPIPIHRSRARRWLVAAAAVAAVVSGLALVGPGVGGSQMDLSGAVSQRAVRVSVDPGFSPVRFVSVVNTP